MKKIATILISLSFLLGSAPLEEYLLSGTECMAYEIQEAYYDGVSVQMRTSCGVVCNDDTMYEMDCDSDFISEATEVLTN